MPTWVCSIDFIHHQSKHPYYNAKENTLFAGKIIKNYN